MRLLTQLRDTVVGKPIIRGSSGAADDANSEQREPEGVYGESAFRIENTARNGWAITGSLYSGLFGEHEFALGLPGEAEDTDLENRAPVRKFRFVFVFPEEGEKGVLAIETIGRSCPADLLTTWLTKKSQIEATQRQEEQDRSDPAPNWWKLVADQMADEEHLNRMIDAGRFQRIDLVKHDILPDRRRNKEILRLTAPNIEGSLATSVAGVVRDWWGRTRGLERRQDVVTTDDHEGAQQLAAIIGNGVEGLDFDDGWVVLAEEDGGRPKRISPSRMSEVFIYPLSDRARFDDAAFFRAIRTRASHIAPTVPIDVTWPL